MATYSGIYKMYEGNTASCAAVQQYREPVFDTESGLIRYLSSSGTVHYFSNIFNHSGLAGLSSDDHTQYLLANGVRTLSGNLAVSSGITIDGVDISAHALDSNAHHSAVTVSDAPLTISDQQITFNYDPANFRLSGNNLQIINSGIDHGTLSGLLDDDHTQYVHISGRAGIAAINPNSGNIKVVLNSTYPNSILLQSGIAGIRPQEAFPSWKTTAWIPLILGYHGAIFQSNDGSNTFGLAYNCFFDSVDNRWEFLGTLSNAYRYDVGNSAAHTWYTSSARGSTGNAITWYKNFSTSYLGDLGYGNFTINPDSVTLDLRYNWTGGIGLFSSGSNGTIQIGTSGAPNWLTGESLDKFTVLHIGKYCSLAYFNSSSASLIISTNLFATDHYNMRRIRDDLSTYYAQGGHAHIFSYAEAGDAGSGVALKQQCRMDRDYISFNADQSSISFKYSYVSGIGFYSDSTNGIFHIGTDSTASWNLADYTSRAILQLGSAVSLTYFPETESAIYINTNAYTSSSGEWSRIADGFVSQYRQHAGTHVFRYGISDSKGQLVSWIPQLELSTSGADISSTLLRARAITASGNLICSGSIYTGTIYGSTGASKTLELRIPSTDGSDTGLIDICAGSIGDTSRGGRISIFGNEYPVVSGYITIKAGVGGQVDIGGNGGTVVLSIGDFMLIRSIKYGATQAAAGASAGEAWYTSSHSSLPDGVLMIGL